MPNHNFKDITGKRFGHLTVLRRGENTKSGLARWICRCDCGNERLVAGSQLRNGHSTSCGCELRKKILSSATKHGMRYTRIYKIWTNIKTRCYNPNAKRHSVYYDRNIEMCDEWKNDFESFYSWSMENGYDDELTIDRIDNEKGYSPDNCRWVTQQEQQRNKRNNKNITYNGKTQCLAAWCEELNLDYKKTYSLITYKHFDIERAFTSK